ncbi:MAG: fused MFS/spermidine synthase [Myxococcales bacterium]|nr:fused MFS/spermidine synthase [Myxococcales bacterium]
MRRLGFLMFVVSGAAGLVFEVALQRSLTRAFGVSALATSTVLAAWMAGLALGALLFGRLADRSKAPLKLYAWLELGIALCAAVMPFVVPVAIDGFASLARGRTLDDPLVRGGLFVMAFGITLVPTLLMGGTLPPVARALASKSELASGDGDIARLYTANVLGAAIGAALGSYVFLPGIGLSASMWLGAAFNVAAAGFGFWLSRRVPVPPPQPETNTSQRAPFSLLALAAWSGLATFVAEVTWFHLLGAVIGTSAYAFGLMLALFLVALTLGSAWVSRQPDAKVEPATLGKVQALIALSMVLTLPLWDKSSALFVVAGNFVSSFAGRELVRAVVAAQLIVIPAAVLGTVYPLALRLGARTGSIGQSIGGLAAANTLGAIGGSLLTGYVLLPALGSRGTILVVVGGCVALALLMADKRSKVIAGAAAVIAVVLPAWNLSSLASGANVYFAETPYYHSQVVWSHESVSSGITSVVRHPKSQKLTLLTNGKFQGNESGEVQAQRAYAQIPLLAVPRFNRGLLIGIGTGGSLGSLAAQPFETIDAVELSTDIIDAARQYFGSVNDGVLSDSSKVKVHVADGRNFLLLSEAQYDLVTIQLSSIWFAGAADLYNRDFYALLKRRLAPGGLVQQWVQLHHMTRRDLAVIIASLKAELPHVTLFFRGNQGLLLASTEPFSFDARELARRSAMLEGTVATRDLPGGDLLVLTGNILLDEAGVDALIAEEAQRWGRGVDRMASTDDNLYLEFSTPRANVDESLMQEALVDSLRALRPEAVPLKGLETDDDRLHARVAFLIGRGRLDEARALIPSPAPPALEKLSAWLAARPPQPE